MEVSSDIQFCSVGTPYASKKQNQRIRGSFRSSIISRIFVAFYLSPLSHEWAACDLNSWEHVLNSLSFAVRFFLWACPPISSPLRELEAWEPGYLCISKAICASAAVVTSVRKDGDEIWWDLEQSESLLPRNPGEHCRQNWTSHCVCGVVAYSTSQIRKSSCAQLGGILLST